jgi:hypothetical protein
MATQDHISNSKIAHSRLSGRGSFFATRPVFKTPHFQNTLRTLSK